MREVCVRRDWHRVDVPSNLPEWLKSEVFLVLNHVYEISACSEHLDRLRVAFKYS